jgi:hypothetical protein
MNKPKIVVLCGSSRFVDIMAVAAWLIERDEKAITMGLHLLPAWYRSASGKLPKHHLAEHESCTEEMDELHLRKIDLCDEIFVVNWAGYIGDSTMREIAYATELRKPIRFYTEDKIGDKVRSIMLTHEQEIMKRIKGTTFDPNT